MFRHRVRKALHGNRAAGIRLSDGLEFDHVFSISALGLLAKEAAVACR